MDLAEFLLARIAEDEAAAYALTDGETLYTAALDEGHGWLIQDLQARVQRTLAECEAKRRIVDHATASAAEADEYDIPTQRTDAVFTLRLLALPYADHGSYREEWKP